MIDAMFEMPSTKTKKLAISLKYAKEKVEKSNVKRLKIA